MSKRASIFLLLAVLLLALIGWHFAGQPLQPGTQAGKATTVVADKPWSAPERRITASAAIATLNERAADSSGPSAIANSIVLDHQAAKDYRAFFDIALSRPKEGGAFLAGLIALDCAALVTHGAKTQAEAYQKRLNSLAPDAPNRLQRIEAIKARHEPCLSFDQAPFLYGTSGAVWKEGSARGDPVLMMMKDLNAIYASDNSLQTLPELLARAVRSNNPYVVEAILMGIASGAVMYPTFINGERVPLEYLPAVLQAAGLIVCQFGMDCGPSSRSALDLCIANNCGADRYQMMQQNLSPREYAQTMVYHDAIVAALRTGNYAAISVQPSPFLKGSPKGK